MAFKVTEDTIQVFSVVSLIIQVCVSVCVCLMTFFPYFSSCWGVEEGSWTKTERVTVGV